MRVFLNQRLQPLTIVVIQNGHPATARLIDELVKAGDFPFPEPDRESVSSNIQDVADLVDRMSMAIRSDPPVANKNDPPVIVS